MVRQGGEGRPQVGRPFAQAGVADEGLPDPSWGPLDQALAAFRSGDIGATLVMRTDVGGAEEVPVSLFFRRPDDMGEVETAALRQARGRVLDVGAGPGAHALPLMRAGHAVTALEVLPQARAALTEGGIADVRAGGLETVAPDERFDTVLALMNGLGLAGSLEGLSAFLAGLAAVLAPGGQILADSTDAAEWDESDDGRYAGEVHMQLCYRDSWGRPFPFLFVDPVRAAEAAASVELDMEVLAEDGDGRYLARFTLARPQPTP